MKKLIVVRLSILVNLIIMNRYLKQHIQWQRRRFGPILRWILIFHIPLFFLIFFILVPGWWAHLRFDLPIGLDNPINLIFGLPLLIFGLVMYLWTVILFAKARGTQVPMAPTQELVTTGPYAVSRNPMMAAGSFMVSGLSLIVNSWSFAMIGLIPFALYLIYIRFVEEKELEARFGHKYKAYREDTPFLVPRLFSKKSMRKSNGKYE